MSPARHGSYTPPDKRMRDFHPLGKGPGVSVHRNLDEPPALGEYLEFSILDMAVRREPLPQRSSIPMYDYTQGTICNPDLPLYREDFHQGEDRPPPSCEIDVTGRTDSDQSVTLTVKFSPHIVIEFPNEVKNVSPNDAVARLRKAMIRSSVAQTVAKYGGQYGPKHSENYRKFEARTLAKVQDRVNAMKLMPRLDFKKKAYGWQPDLNAPVGSHRIREFPILTVYFNNERARNLAMEALFEQRESAWIKGWTQCEVGFDLPAQLLDQAGLTAGAKCKVLTKCIKSRSRAFFHTDMEFTVSYNPLRDATHVREANGQPPKLTASEDTQAVPMMRIASFDIECISCEGFPQAVRKSDEIISVATAFYNTRTKEIQTIVHSLNGVHPDPVEGDADEEALEDEISGFVLKQYNTELQLLNAWRNDVVMMDVDIFIGWNSDKFDFKYMNDRILFHYSSHATSFFNLSRQIDHRCKIIERETTTGAHGTQITHKFNMRGRFSLDMMVWVMKDPKCKFDSYTLSNVSKLVLKDDKIDLKADEMNRLWKSGDPKARRRVIVYNVKDVLLPIRLWQKMLVHEMLVEGSRTNMVVPRRMLGGLDFRSNCHLYRFFHQHGFVMNQRPGADLKRPTWRLRQDLDKRLSAEKKRLKKQIMKNNRKLKRIRARIRLNSWVTPHEPMPRSLRKAHGRRWGRAYAKQHLGDDKEARNLLAAENTRLRKEMKGIKYQGATVLTALSGLHKMVATMDFASLYPSVIRAWNLCFSTLVLEDELKNLPGWTYHEHDLGDGVTATFVQDVKGILPMACENLLNLRAQAKKRLKAAKRAGDTELANILDSRQMSIKIACNSLYGVTGTNPMIGMYSCKEIARMTTSMGRELIAQTKKFMEDEYAEEYGAKVIYGDTDSVFVKFTKIQCTPEGIELAFRVATEAVEAVNATFPDAVKLEMEKLYTDYLLISKKRYAGLKLEKADGKPKLDAKGLALVRRDFTNWEKRLFTKVLVSILNKFDPNEAFGHLVEELQLLLDGEVELDDLVKSCKLKAKYKVPVPQLRVVEKMQERQPGSEPRVGDRVQYTMIFPLWATKKTKNIDLAEDVEYVRAQGIKPDSVYFIQHVRNSITQLFSPFDVSDRIELIFDQAVEYATVRRSSQRSIVDMLDKDGERIVDVYAGTEVDNANEEMAAYDEEEEEDDPWEHKERDPDAVEEGEEESKFIPMEEEEEKKKTVFFRPKLMSAKGKRELAKIQKEERLRLREEENKRQAAQMRKFFKSTGKKKRKRDEEEEEEEEKKMVDDEEDEEVAERKRARQKKKKQKAAKWKRIQQRQKQTQERRNYYSDALARINARED